MEDCNLDFKENILKKVITLKLKDTAELNMRVDEIKHEEFVQLEQLNKQYGVLEKSERETDTKIEGKKLLLDRVVEQWQVLRVRRRVFKAWQARVEAKHKAMA